MLKRQTGYQVGDKWFDKKAEAAAYLARTQLAALTDRFDADQHDITDWMVDQGWPLINILSDIARRNGGPKAAPETQIAPGQVNGRA